MRRKNYEVFYYLHHVYLVLFIVTLLHAASAWYDVIIPSPANSANRTTPTDPADPTDPTDSRYYLIGGLSLWFFDRCLRAYQRGRQWSLRSLEVFDLVGVTALDLSPGEDLLWGKGAGFKYSSGQYLYLNVPAISSFEWHPFTISSAPSDGKVTCHIKMAPTGDTSFTGKLLNLAKSGLAPQALQVNVDGPYGEHLDPTDFDTILLVAGGIGVTPIHSIFRELRNRLIKGSCDLKRVHLLWVVQKCDDTAPFWDTLMDAQNKPLDGRLRVSVYVDKDEACPPGTQASVNGLSVMGGRPDVVREIEALR